MAWKTGVSALRCTSWDAPIKGKLAMAFQIVELTLDADDAVVERRVVPYPYPSREEAVDTIESVIERFAEAGYESEGDFWWALAANKTRVRFIIEVV
jgi:hypothetical protein